MKELQSHVVGRPGVILILPRQVCSPAPGSVFGGGRKGLAGSCLCEERSLRRGAEVRNWSLNHWQENRAVTGEPFFPLYWRSAHFLFQDFPRKALERRPQAGEKIKVPRLRRPILALQLQMRRKRFQRALARRYS